MTFVNDSSELPDNPPVGSLYCVVSDHGNATLYSGARVNGKATFHEIWSIV